MALILNIDTATETGSVCLARNGTPITTRINNRQKEHAAVLPLFIDELMKGSGTTPAAIDAIAISGGPGSYTGLRVAAATAKGLCFAWNKPLIAVNTLEMMANGMRMTMKGGTLLCPMIDARRDEVFTAVYGMDLSAVVAPLALILSPDSFRDQLQQHQVCFFGSGSEKWKRMAPDSAQTIFVEYQPQASHLVSLAEKAWEEKIFEDPAYFEPFYLKSFYTSANN